jgi:flagellar biosynthesis/type III secretory pathway ATPase
VLVEADDPNEPISDSVRGILDGHIVLSRKLAQQGHFPAIDILASISRLMSDLACDEHNQAAISIRQLMSAYHQAEDLISIGAYQSGSNPTVDAAIRLRERIRSYLCQSATENGTLFSFRRRRRDPIKVRLTS